MKKINVLKLGIGALVAGLCTGSITQAWSQSSEAPVTASGAGTAKAARQANRALRKQIYAAFARHDEIDAGSLSVTAKNGAVAIGGTVTDAAQIGKIAEIARGVAGVTSVTTKIAVQKPLFQ